MNIQSVHQFVRDCCADSGVTNKVISIQTWLRQSGFESHIYSTQVPPELAAQVICIANAKELPEDTNAIMLVLDEVDWEESSINRESYAIVKQLPSVVGTSFRLENQLPLQRWFHLKDTCNLLSAGDICERSNQLALLDVLQACSQISEIPMRLILAGESNSATYLEKIQQRTNELGLQQRVLITGKLPESELAALCQSVDIYVCIGENEGVVKGLNHALYFNLPVIAKISEAMSVALENAGCLLSESVSPSEFAAAIVTVVKEPSLKRDILLRQRQHLQKNAQEHYHSQVKQVLFECGIEISTAPTTNTIASEQERWQIEGPFDSSYSLAIVNRELARALDAQNVDVALRSHEGFGDFEPSSEFLQHDGDCQRMVQRYETASQRAESPYAALRFCYPPHVDAMPAVARVVHSYGWEETGFPQAYVDAFNRRLDLITVLSTSVGKTLRDNGVRIPIVVTGAGVDHIQPVQAQALPQSVASQLKAFRFLHVSSCFPRKAVDVLLQAYADTFTAHDEVTLIIKTFANPHHQILRDIDLLKATHPSFPHVVVIDEDWSQAAMAGLYAACHAYVAASRGEGLGLPLAEAMLFDLPVITTAWGGQTDFCDETTAWCCDFDFAKAETHMGMTHSLWAEPRRAHLGALMKNLVQLDDTEKKRRTNKARERVLEQLSWQQTANRVRQAVDALKSEKLLRKEPKIGWISTWNARCGIANYSHFLTQQIPPSRLCVLANHIPERMAIDQDYVLRCWNAEQAETFEYALETMLEQGIEAVVIQYNFGFCSTQNLAAFLLQLKAHRIQAHVFFHSTADVPHEGEIKSLGTIKTVLAQVERLYVHGLDDVNRLKNWGIVDNVVYFPHGVAPMVERQWGRPPQFQGKTVIASYGFLLPHKGIRELIEAFALLRRDHDDYHLLLINALYPAQLSTLEAEFCRQRIEELGLQEHVTLITDYLSDQETKQHLSNADLIVYAYQGTQESSSAAVRVGLSVGSPVLVTPLAIFSDVAEAVHYLPGTSAEMIAAGIRQFMKQEAQSEEKKSRIERWFAERSWPMLSRRLVNIIDGLANPLGGGGRNC